MGHLHSHSMLQEGSCWASLARILLETVLVQWSLQPGSSWGQAPSVNPTKAARALWPIFMTLILASSREEIHWGWIKYPRWESCFCGVYFEAGDKQQKFYILDPQWSYEQSQASTEGWGIGLQYSPRLKPGWGLRFQADCAKLGNWVFAGGRTSSESWPTWKWPNRGSVIGIIFSYTPLERRRGPWRCQSYRSRY